jgi:MFS family permease
MLFGMERGLYFKLSALMFLEYAIWGSWYPVLAPRLLGPLKFSAKQSGWIYATIPLGCIFMPLAAGQMADRWINTELILAGAHLIGALLMFVAAWRKKFGGLLVTLLLYALCYAATIPLVNSLMFHHLEANEVSVEEASPYIFVWAPIAWALAGYCLTGWRWVFKTGERGRDCLIFAALLSVGMAVFCGTLLPETPPAGASEGGAHQALSMLNDSPFLVFILITIVASGMMQFYFLGTARFMQENGIPPKNVPASMALGQVVQAVATWFLLGWLLGHEQIGFKWTLAIGAAFWLLLYVIYVAPGPRARIVIAQAFHGLAYAFFIIGGQVYGKSVAPEGTDASVQALVITAQSGLGLFLGTQLAGAVMDMFRTSEDKFRWRGLWLVPALIMATCIAALILFFESAV